MAAKIQIVNISDIKPNPNNPRVIKDYAFEKLVQSISSFPQMLSLRPIIVNDDMVILGGNMRFKACQAAGFKEVPIVKASGLTEEQQKEFIIKDNVGFGEWDMDDLANNWDIELLSEWGLEVIPQDWGSLDYIDEAERPDLSKKLNIQITIPEAYAEEKKKLEQDLAEYLSKNWSGCAIK